MFYSLNVLSAGRWVLLKQFDDIEPCRQFLFDIVRLVMIGNDILPRPGFIFKLQPDTPISLDGNIYLIRECQ